MNCTQCRYLETDIDCGVTVIHCGAVPEEYPKGCWKVKEEDDEE